jgi:hypothetical protein
MTGGDQRQPAPVELEYIPQPIPIYMIGESHCVVFTDRIFREKRYLNETFIGRCMYLPGVSTHDFVEQQFDRVVKAFMGEHLIVGDPRGDPNTPWTPMHAATNNLHIPFKEATRPANCGDVLRGDSAAVDLPPPARQQRLRAAFSNTWDRKAAGR